MSAEAWAILAVAGVLACQLVLSLVAWRKLGTFIGVKPRRKSSRKVRQIGISCGRRVAERRSWWARQANLLLAETTREPR